MSEAKPQDGFSTAKSSRINLRLLLFLAQYE